MFLYLKIHNRTFLKHCAMVLQTADSNIADHREIATTFVQRTPHWRKATQTCWKNVKMEM